MSWRKWQWPIRIEAVSLIFVLSLCAGEPTILDDFQKRVKDYAALHRKLDGEMPRLKASPAEALDKHQHELAARIAAARQSAAQGNIFTPPIAAEFHELIAGALRGDRAMRIRRSLAAAEPVQMEARVNEVYPHHVPLQTMPPTLLLSLPKLPKELDYRLIGHSLVLRDAEANLIVDILPNAIP